MMQVIAGKIYNTDTADEVGSWSFGREGDFSHEEESLYRSPKGQYFLAGSGGPRSSYAKSIARNSWSGGAGIRLLSIEEAREWAETHLTGEAVAAEFDVEIG